ncbi:MAG: hypothetical protein QOH93_1319 [Chloroflexia bacterium]|nr:hypothetical protein [Chloroflexia bacterium]
MTIAMFGTAATFLLFAYLTWREPPTQHRQRQLVRLSLVFTIVWIADILLLTLANVAAEPGLIISSLMRSSSGETFDSRIFSLTLGSPATLLGNTSCLAVVLVPFILYGLGWLPALGKRYGHLSFWLTLLVIGYDGLLFGGSGTLDLARDAATWALLWLLFGAISEVIMESAGILLAMRRGQQMPWLRIGIVVARVTAGSVSAVAGLGLGMLVSSSKAGSLRATYPEMFSMSVACVIAVLLLSGAVGIVVGFVTPPADQGYAIQPDKPVQPPRSTSPS